MNGQDKEACAVKDFCKIWAMNFGLWDSVLLISVNRSCICGSSGEGILHRWCELPVWGLVKLENKSFGFKSVLLPCCLLDKRLPILTLSGWVKKGVWLLFGPSPFWWQVVARMVTLFTSLLKSTLSWKRWTNINSYKWMVNNTILLGGWVSFHLIFSQKTTLVTYESSYCSPMVK